MSAPLFRLTFATVTFLAAASAGAIDLDAGNCRGMNETLFPAGSVPPGTTVRLSLSDRGAEQVRFELSHFPAGGGMPELYRFAISRTHLIAHVQREAARLGRSVNGAEQARVLNEDLQRYLAWPTAGVTDAAVVARLLRQFCTVAVELADRDAERVALAPLTASQILKKLDRGEWQALAGRYRALGPDWPRKYDVSPALLRQSDPRILIHELERRAARAN